MNPPMFDGATYDEAHDRDRLTGLLGRVWQEMDDDGWHTLSDLALVCESTTASVSARLRDFRKPRFGGHTVERRRTKTPGTFVYRLVPREGGLLDGSDHTDEPESRAEERARLQAEINRWRAAAGALTVECPYCGSEVTLQ